jgi:hypothetical protein
MGRGYTRIGLIFADFFAIAIETASAESLPSSSANIRQIRVHPRSILSFSVVPAGRCPAEGVRKINHQGTKITKKHKGMQSKEKSKKLGDEASPPISISSLPWCVFVPFVPWWFVFLGAPAGR